MNKSSKFIAKSGLVAAFYILLTLPFGGLSTSPIFQVRLGEGLCLLPILASPSIVGLAVGCFVVNLFTSSVMDACFGAAITLLAGYLTRKLKNPLLGSLSPILLNAFGVPLVYMLMGYQTAYWLTFLQVLCSQAVWVLGLGLPVFYAVKRMSRDVEGLID